MTNFVVVVSPVKKVVAYYVDLPCPQGLMNFHFLIPILDQFADFEDPLAHCVNDGWIKVLSGIRTRYQALFAHCHADFGLLMSLRGRLCDVDLPVRQARLRSRHSYLIDLLVFLSSIAPCLKRKFCFRYHNLWLTLWKFLQGLSFGFDRL